MPIDDFAPKELYAVRNRDVSGLPVPSGAPPPLGSEVQTGPVGPHPKMFIPWRKEDRQVFRSQYIDVIKKLHIFG